MKIAYIGDSFCADANRNFTQEDNERPTWLAWTELVARNYNAEIMCVGERGMALFYTYETLLQIIDDADYIILCITREFRLPNMHRMPITFHHHSGHQLGKTVSLAAEHYYEHLISFDFHRLVHYLLIKEIDSILKEQDKKCIWFFVSHTSNKINSGPIGDTSLSVLSDYDLASSGVKKDDIDDYWQTKTVAGVEWMTRLNHLNEKNNKNMSKFIINVIDNDDFTSRRIIMNDYFKLLGPTSRSLGIAEGY